MGVTPRLTASLLARKYHFVCENDVPGVLTQTILGLLSDQMSAYWELYEVLNDGILMGCCGFSPECLLAEAVKVRKFESVVVGMGCCSKIKEGRYTLARLGKEHEGGFALHCVEGQACQPPSWCEEALGPPQHPSVRFVPSVAVEQVMRWVLAQHFAVVPGSWADALVEFAGIKGISCRQ
jgi:L-fucose isomerase-like protein